MNSRIFRSIFFSCVLLFPLCVPAISAAQADQPSGRIAFIRQGNIWQWSADGGRELLESGTATDPDWAPDGASMVYVRDQGSFSDLMITDFGTSGSDQITDYESDAEVGSPEYVASSYWAVDPAWSEAGLIVFGSDIESGNATIQLRVFNPETGETYAAASDGGDQGTIDQFDVDADSTLAAYTVLASGGENGGITYVSLRDLNTGESFPIAEGPLGAYGPAIAPTEPLVAVSVRDSQGVSDIWVVDRTTDLSVQLTDGQNATNAVWSPDGQWIAYTRLSGRKFEIWATPVDESTGASRGDPVKLVSEDDLNATSGLTWAP